MNKKNTLQIAVSEQVKVLDIFVTAKKWAEKKVVIFVEKVRVIFSSGSCKNWKAIPVRGPNVSKYFSNSVTDYVFLA